MKQFEDLESMGLSDSFGFFQIVFGHFRAFSHHYATYATLRLQGSTIDRGPEICHHFRLSYLR